MALTTTTGPVLALLDFANNTKIVFGSDFPYGTLNTDLFVASSRETILAALGKSDLIQDINNGNAKRSDYKLGL